MIILYQFASSPFSEKVRRALHYKKLPYQIHEVDRFAVDKLTHVSSFGKFPAMEDDGEPICDSTDIVRHLENRYPEHPLIPGDAGEAAQVHIFEDWADESLYHYEVTMRIAWEHNARKTLAAIMPTMPDKLSEDQVLQMMLEGAANTSNAQGLGRKTREQVVADVERHALALDAMLAGRDWLVGDALSLADISVLSQLNCLMYTDEFVSILENTRNLRPWMERVDSLAPAQKHDAGLNNEPS